MVTRAEKEFCIECRNETEYALKKKKISKIIRDREYSFWITTAICTECGAEMSLPGLIDKNVKEIDEQYREMEGIVSVEDIENLLKIYKIGKAPASYALGFGEITISRYLSGQIPSKEYSDIIKKALTSPTFMKLTKDEQKVVDLVLNTFGMYGGKTLERITHKEEPWIEARKGYDDGIPSQEILPKESIKRYFMAVNERYNIGTEDGLRNYIIDMIQ